MRYIRAFDPRKDEDIRGTGGTVFTTYRRDWRSPGDAGLISVAREICQHLNRGHDATSKVDLI